jgi:hypothetical protein
MLSARLNRYYCRLRLHARPPSTSRRVPVIGRPASGDINPHAGHRAGQGLSCSRRYYPDVPRPLRRGVLRRLHIQVFSAFHGLHPEVPGSALPLSVSRRDFDDAAGFASCYGPPGCSPFKGFRRWASTPTVTRDAASLLQGRLAATPTGLTPASNDEHGQPSTAHAINLQPSGHTAEEIHSLTALHQMHDAGLGLLRFQTEFGQQNP